VRTDLNTLLTGLNVWNDDHLAAGRADYDRVCQIMRSPVSTLR